MSSVGSHADSGSVFRPVYRQLTRSRRVLAGRREAWKNAQEK